MGRQAEKTRRRFSKRLLISVTEEMHRRLDEYARRRGLTMAAAIRLLIADALMAEGHEREPTKKRKSEVMNDD